MKDYFVEKEVNRSRAIGESGSPKRLLRVTAHFEDRPDPSFELNAQCASAIVACGKDGPTTDTTEHSVCVHGRDSDLAMLIESISYTMASNIRQVMGEQGAYEVMKRLIQAFIKGMNKGLAEG